MLYLKAGWWMRVGDLLNTLFLSSSEIFANSSRMLIEKSGWRKGETCLMIWERDMNISYSVSIGT